MKNSRRKYNHDARSSIFPGTPASSREDRTVEKRLGFIIGSLPERCARVLDVGCGKGVYLEPLSRFSAQAVGIDIHYGYLQAGGANDLNRKIQMAQMDVSTLAFAEDSFDAVTMIEVLEHLPDDARALHEIGRVLKRGGYLIATAPSKLFPLETHPIRIRGVHRGSRWGTGIPLLPLIPRGLRRHFATVQLYYPWEIRKMLQDCGFAIRTMGFLMPGLDALSKSLPEKATSIVEWTGKMCDLLERSPLRALGSTILVVAINVR